MKEKKFYEYYKEISEDEMFLKQKNGRLIRIVDHWFEQFHDITVTVCDEDKTVSYGKFYIGE